MLKTRLIHPEILDSLGRAGHGSRLLIADGNYPFGTQLGPHADLVHLNLEPGTVSATRVLEVLLSAVPVEAAAVMDTQKAGPYAMSEEPEIWAEFRRLLDRGGAGVELEKIERFRFYEEASTTDVALTIATGEQRIYANLLLTIGVVMPR